VNRTTNAYLIATIAAVLSACLVTTVTETESFDSAVTDNYSHLTGQTQKAQVLDPECRWPCYRLGESKVSFFPSKRSDNVKAAGPIVPIFPAPGEGTSYGDSLFFVGIHVHPGSSSFLILQPTEYRISVEGVDETLVPVTVEDCYGYPVDKSDLHVYGVKRCYVLYFGITRDEVEHFTLIPANIEADQIQYAFPDVDWVPGTYTWVE
jgi:hypothetical protein